MFAIQIVQPEGHPKAAGVYIAERLRHAAARIETQQVIEEQFVKRSDAGNVDYQWTTVFTPPPEIDAEKRRR